MVASDQSRFTQSQRKMTLIAEANHCYIQTYCQWRSLPLFWNPFLKPNYVAPILPITLPNHLIIHLTHNPTRHSPHVSASPRQINNRQSPHTSIHNHNLTRHVPHALASPRHIHNHNPTRHSPHASIHKHNSTRHSPPQFAVSLLYREREQETNIERDWERQTEREWESERQKIERCMNSWTWKLSLF